MAAVKVAKNSPPDRILTQIQRKDATYLGVVVVQASGAWTRCGPTWVVPGLGWIVYGPGLAEWKTNKGLAQLACETVEPRYHATAWGISPVPNIAFAIEDDQIKNLKDVAAAVAAVAHLVPKAGA